MKHRWSKYVEVLCGRSACVILIAAYIADVAPECPLENDFGATISLQASNAPLAATRYGCERQLVLAAQARAAALGAGQDTTRLLPQSEAPAG